MSHSSTNPHNRSVRNDDDEDEDTPAERALRKAGCLEHHYRVGLLFALPTSSLSHSSKKIGKNQYYYYMTPSLAVVHL